MLCWRKCSTALVRRWALNALFFRELTALDRGAKCCIGGEPNAVAKEKPILLPTGSQML